MTPLHHLRLLITYHPSWSGKWHQHALLASGKELPINSRNGTVWTLSDKQLADTTVHSKDIVRITSHVDWGY